MAADLLMADDAEDPEETLRRHKEEWQEDADEKMPNVREKMSKPSHSYGCARTSGVAVYRKPQPSCNREKRPPKDSSAQNTDVCQKSNGKLTDARAIRHLKRIASQEASIKIKMVVEPKLTKTVKTNRMSKSGNQSTVKTSKRKPRPTEQKNDRGRLSCDECGAVFTFRGNLRRHKELHRVASNEYSCKECGKTFSAKRNYSRHLKCHEPVDPKDRPYSCDKCDKSFHRPKYLYHHKKVHDVTRPHTCQFCTKTFKTRFNLQSHEAIHINCKQYVCQFCGMAFTRSSYRTIHERIHTNERPFKCDECDKAFVRGDHLKSHKKIHGNMTLTMKMSQNQVQDNVLS